MDARVTEATSSAKPISPGRAVLLPGAFAALLAAFVFVPPVSADPQLIRTFLFAAGALVAWGAMLFLAARAAGRALTLEIVIRKPHWVQACAQTTIILYWGWYVRTVYAFLPFIAAQLIFAYAVDGLLNWSRRDNYQLGFGPFPIILSINLFLWFKQDWFHWQFAMILLGYVGKELIRWTKNGRSAHVFNPSSFPLAVCSLVLITTGTTDITWGQEIASTQYNPPHIFAVMFLASLPGQILFGVATMTMTAVISAYAFGLGYFLLTGTYFFQDAFIPIAVFLGMHLLFTDPSTSPRTERGRIIFGVLYGFGTIAFAALFRAIGVPPFYDKLLPVPLLNMSIQVIDRAAVTKWFRFIDFSWIGAAMTAPRRRYSVVAVWVAVFLGISVAGGLGDNHPGQYLPFWAQACEEGSERACDYSAGMQTTYCDRESGWACNELGILQGTRQVRNEATASFTRGCDLGFSPACENLTRITTGSPGFASAPPPLQELPIVLRGSKGPVLESTPAALYALGCERGWTEMCSGAPSDGRP
jgi:hypothetical protein